MQSNIVLLQAEVFKVLNLNTYVEVQLSTVPIKHSTTSRSTLLFFYSSKFYFKYKN